MRDAIMTGLSAIAVAALLGIVTLAARAGSLETRVAALEMDRVTTQNKLDRLIESQQATREAVAGLLSRIDTRIDRR